MQAGLDKRDSSAEGCSPTAFPLNTPSIGGKPGRTLSSRQRHHGCNLPQEGNDSAVHQAALLSASRRRQPNASIPEASHA